MSDPLITGSTKETVITKEWPRVPLESVLRHRKEFIFIDDLKIYKRCRVQLHAQGIVLRDQVTGSEIKTKSQQVCRAGEFLVAEIDAKVGGFGIVPEELDSAIVSSHYFLFEVDSQLLDRRFLDYYIRTQEFREQVSAQGSTNYAAIRPRDVLGYSIPLPPLPEQRQLVERISALARNIEEAVVLVRETDLQREALCRSLITDESHSSSIRTPMSDLLRLRQPDVIVNQEETYHFAGVFCFGRGVFRGQRITGLETSYKNLTRLNVNNFVYPKLMAWEGALAIVPPECDGLVVSTEFPVFEIDQSKVLPEVLDVYFRTPSVWPQLAGVSTGTNARRRRLNPSDFLNYQMSIPPMETQQKLRLVRQAIGQIKEIRSSLTTELDSLLPAVFNQAFNGSL